MPRALSAIRREHVEAFLVDLQARGMKPATVSQRYRSLQQFMRWAKDEGEIRESPMANMKPPHVPETPPPVLTDEELRALLKAADGTDFDKRRDTAILRLFLDTGMRRAELAGQSSPGSRSPTSTGTMTWRWCSARAGAREPARSAARRPRRSTATSAPGRSIRTPMLTGSLPHVHPHLFRHTYAHLYLADGGNEGDLMRLAGWRSRQMLSRYGASAADERARAAWRLTTAPAGVRLTADGCGL